MFTCPHAWPFRCTDVVLRVPHIFSCANHRAVSDFAVNRGLSFAVEKVEAAPARASRTSAIIQASDIIVSTVLFLCA